jgi:general secretion pathway protein K
MACNNIQVHSQQAGFALVLVIWIIGLVSLLTLGVIWSSRLNIQAAGNNLENARAEALADAGIQLVRLAAFHSVDASPDIREKNTMSIGGMVKIVCAMPDDAIALIVVENEAGKINLNTASAELLEQFLAGLDLEQINEREMAEAIAAFRSVRAGEERSAQYPYDIPLKHAPFETVLELDQIPGMTRASLETILPHVSVSKKAGAFDIALASPALRAILDNTSVSTGRDLFSTLRSGAPAPDSMAAITQLLGDGAGDFLVHVEIMTNGGGHFVREAIITLSGIGRWPRVAEWRRGRARYNKTLPVLAKPSPENSGAISHCSGQS